MLYNITKSFKGSKTMTKKQTLSVTLKLSALLLLFATANLQTIAMLTAYEPDTSYFSAGSPFPPLAVLCAVLAALCGIVHVCVSDASQINVAPFSLLASLISGTCFLLCGIILSLCSTLNWSLATALFFFLAAAYSFLSGSVFAKKYPAAVALLGFTAVIACALGNMYCYFDISLEMNAPAKVLVQTSLLFSMIYYTGEIRFLLGREKTRFYQILAFCTLAANVLCVTALPVAYFKGAFCRIDYLGLSIASLGVFLSILIRLLTVSKSHENIPKCQENEAADTEPCAAPPATDIEEPLPCNDPDTEEQKETDEE